MDAPGFSNLEWLGDTPKEREAKCRHFAAEAKRFADEAQNEMREAYLDLATQWTLLADEIAAERMRDKH